MTIWIDADGCPREIREIVVRAALRLCMAAVFVADRPIPVADSPYIKVQLVAAGRDAADRAIRQSARSGDLAVTADIPLAAQLIKEGIDVIHPRGDLLDRETVGERLSMRDFLTGLRGLGLDTGAETTGNRHFRRGGKRQFAATLDRELTRRAAEGY